MNLEEEQRVYHLSDCITFRKTTEKYGGLSNMASGYSLIINGIYIRSSEALYQAMRFPHLPHVQKEIINESSPMTAKMISKKYRPKTRDDWEKIKIPIMQWVLRVKLVQNLDTFGKLLLETDSKNIVEESVKDAFWGAKIIDDQLVGINALGRLLMQLRELHMKYQITLVPPLQIDNFKIYGDAIKSVTMTDKTENSFEDGLFYHNDNDLEDSLFNSFRPK